MKKLYSKPIIASQNIALQSSIMSPVIDNSDPNNDTPIQGAPARKLYV